MGLRMKTYDGTLLENLQSFSDRFESYAMQRTLANNLYAYAFPATFLILPCWHVLSNAAFWTTWGQRVQLSGCECCVVERIFNPYLFLGGSQPYP